MKCIILMLYILLSTIVFAQKEKPLNYHKFDNRVVHFGFMLGINSSSYSMYQKLNNYQQYKLMSMTVEPQPGAQLGVLSTIKLGTPMVRMRLITSISFHERLIRQTFVDNKDSLSISINEERIQGTTIDIPIMFQFRTLRLNNFTAYWLFGAKYSYDLQSQAEKTQSFDDPFIKMKEHDFLGEIGIGIEFFAPYFKCGLEIKYSHSFINGLIQDETPVSLPIDKLYNRSWRFSIIFEG